MVSTIPKYTINDINGLYTPSKDMEGLWHCLTGMIREASIDPYWKHEWASAGLIVSNSDKYRNDWLFDSISGQKVPRLHCAYECLETEATLSEVDSVGNTCYINVSSCSSIALAVNHVNYDTSSLGQTHLFLLLRPCL